MKTCVIIPAYNVKSHVLAVIEKIGPEVDRIYVVDDCCPEHSGQHVRENCTDSRVSVIHNEINLGVGGAVKAGYRAGLHDGMDIFVKIDGDGQMDPALLPKFVRPILRGDVDYAKGNRFYNLESLNQMPAIRTFGNAGLSFVNKFASGYWDIMDPTNGYIAIHHTALELLPLDKISDRYFFESDMLFRLGTIKAVVRDVPMDAIYGEESSNLNVTKTAFQFAPLYLKCFFKRVFYTYFLRDFNAATVEMLTGTLLLLFGAIFGFSQWVNASNQGEFASTGTVMLAVVPLIMGFQLMLSALHYDINSVPRISLQALFGYQR